MFKITGHGKAYKFATLEEAKAAAERVWQELGVIVGIEAA